MRFLQYELERWKACYLLWSDAGPIWRQPCMLQIHFALYNISFPSRHAVFSDLGMRCFFLKVIVWCCLKVIVCTCLFVKKTANTISLWDEQCRFWRNATECLKGMLPIEMEWFSQECCVLWMKVPASVLLMSAKITSKKYCYNPGRTISCNVILHIF